MKNYTVSVFKVAKLSLPIAENRNLAFFNVCEMHALNLIIVFLKIVFFLFCSSIKIIILSHYAVVQKNNCVLILKKWFKSSTIRRVLSFSFLFFGCCNICIATNFTFKG